MKDIVFMFEIHQPRRLKPNLDEVLINPKKDMVDLNELFDEKLDREVFKRAARKCYLPTTKIILEAIERFGERFKVTYSVSGVFLEQAEMWEPEIIELFKTLVLSGSVEFIAQTYYHSLAWFISKDEFKTQILEHVKAFKKILGYEPKAVENTEFIYNNDIAMTLNKMGFRTIVTEGVDRILRWRSPNYVYRAWGCDTRVLTRNYRLSDDIGFRFSNREWDQYPLTADKYASWLSSTPGQVIFIALDYESFGEHHWPESGIHEFLKWLPREVLKHGNMKFSTVSEAAYDNEPVDIIDVPPWDTISWSGEERDISAWLGNDIQKEAFNFYKKLERS